MIILTRKQTEAVSLGGCLCFCTNKQDHGAFAKQNVLTGSWHVIFLECLLHGISGIDGNLPDITFWKRWQCQLSGEPVCVDSQKDKIFLLSCLVKPGKQDTADMRVVGWSGFRGWMRAAHCRICGITWFQIFADHGILFAECDHVLKECKQSLMFR